MKKFRFKVPVGILSLVVCIASVGFIAYAAPGGLKVVLEDGTTWTIDNMTPVVVRDFDGTHPGDVQIDRIMYKDAPNATAVEVYRYVTQLWYHTATVANGARSTYELVPSKTQPVGINTTVRPTLEADYVFKDENNQDVVYAFQGWSLTQGSTTVDYAHLENVPAEDLVGGEVHLYAVYKCEYTQPDAEPFEPGKHVSWSYTAYLTGQISLKYVEKVAVHGYNGIFKGSVVGGTLQNFYEHDGTITGSNNTWSGDLVSLAGSNSDNEVFQAGWILNAPENEDPEAPAQEPILLGEFRAVEY